MRDSKQTLLEQAYLALLEFLMLNKRQIIEYGDRYGLTGMQVMTLFTLDNPLPMNGIKNLFNCDASNVTGIVDGLEEKHLAARFERSDDRRIKMVKLSRQGVKVRSNLLKNLTAQNGSILSKLSPNEVKTFFELIQKITKV